LSGLSRVDGGPGQGYGDSMDYKHLITIEPDKRSGQPCIRGLRMTVQDVLEYLAAGMTVDEILADSPDLTAEDIRACLAFAADRERRLRVVPTA
jgi:uncharacterized protein (DUF433 family)